MALLLKSPRTSAESFSPRRRLFMRHGAALASALGTGSLANLVLPMSQAQAADYRALVCVFLYGGNDAMNMIVPTDSQRYSQYSSVRSALALPSSSLLPLSGTQFGLHPSMSALTPVWSAGQLAPVFNVGPLKQPLTKAQYLAGPTVGAGGPVPDSLFSHADQQALWQTASATTSALNGWGGLASDALGTANPVIAVAETPRFGLSGARMPLTVQNPGDYFGAYNLAAGSARRAAVDAMLAATENRPLHKAHMNIVGSAFGTADRLGPILQAKPGDAAAVAAIDSAFAPLTASGSITTTIGRALYQVAKLVANNATVGGSRQIFFTSLGGFDTHGSQVNSGQPTVGTHASLLKDLADALACFWNAMNAVSLGASVTTFTQSDFARTFAPNNSLGTDHAWGSHHLVMGGAVHGGATYGTYPDLTLGGNDDVGKESWERQGRWIPTTSVSQYAGTLLSWLGLSGASLGGVLPDLGNFSTQNVGFV